MPYSDISPALKLDKFIVNVTELVYVLDLKSNDLGLKGSTPFIHIFYYLILFC